MKRAWIGAALLVGLLAVGLWSMSAMDRVHSDIADELRRSARAAQQMQWAQADDALEQATEQWQESWKFTAAMADHTALDEIDALFAQAEVYRSSRSQPLYAAACARLAQLVEALQEGHRLTWWNLL